MLLFKSLLVPKIAMRNILEQKQKNICLVLNMKIICTFNAAFYINIGNLSTVSFIILWNTTYPFSMETVMKLS